MGTDGKRIGRHGRRTAPVRWRRGAGLWLLLCVAGMWFVAERRPIVRAAERAGPVATPVLETPDAACAGCHRQIAESYARTTMARGSGIATAALIPGSYHDRSSGVDYRVFLRDGAAWMSYSRSSGPELAGERQLQLFVGSGHQGRTYLYQVGDAWFELPINFYARSARWEMAPNMEGESSMPAPLPVDANCLHCHASEVQAPLPEARNRYATLPFRAGGVSCASCHGDGAAHVASGGTVKMVDPDQLSPSRRDSVCLQCHLEGDAVVYRAGRSLSQFRPGDDLAEDAVYFVRAAAAAGGLRATSQYEAMLRSACKRATGDRLTCTTCHDPHSSPAPAERVQFFRSKCLSCHTGAAMAERHHPEQQDCATCHMPSRSTIDISHEQVTDHDIEARPHRGAGAALQLLALSGDDLLVPVGASAAGDRETGLAYAQMARRGSAGAAEQAMKLLRRAELAGAHDAAVEVELGYLEQLQGKKEAARASYSAALVQAPFDPTALADLAVLDASSGDLPGAIPLLQRLVGADPSQTSAGLDLAYLACTLGKPEQARRLVRELAEVHPDDQRIRIFLESGQYNGRTCSRIHESSAPTLQSATPR